MMQVGRTEAVEFSVVYDNHWKRNGNVLVLIGKDMPFIGIFHMFNDGFTGIEFLGSLCFWHQKQQTERKTHLCAYFKNV